MNALPLQVRSLVATHGRLLALLFLLAGVVVTGAAGWHAATPAYETTVARTDDGSVTTRVDTSALVTGESALYERGTRLENETVYLADAAPELTLHGRVDAPSDHRVVVTQRLLVSYEAVRGDSVFWRENLTVARERAPVEDGTMRLDGTLDVRAVRERLNSINAELGDAGHARARVVHTVSYRTSEDEHTLASSAPLRVSRQSYAIEGSLAASRDHVTEEPVRSLATSGVLSTSVGGRDVVVDDAALGGFLLATLSWAGAVLAGRYGPRLDADAIQEELLEARYQEWISAGTLPPTGDRTLIRMASLTDLVDAAIDARKRVVHDRERDAYAVFDGEYVYCHQLEYHLDDEIETHPGSGAHTHGLNQPVRTNGGERLGPAESPPILEKEIGDGTGFHWYGDD